MTTDKSWNMLARYLAGECTRRERAEIRAWAEADPSLARFLESLEEIWERAGEALDIGELDRWDESGAWHEFARKLEAAPAEEASFSAAAAPSKIISSKVISLPAPEPTKSRRRSRWASLGVLRAAAAVVLVVAGAAIVPELVQRLRGPEPSRTFVTGRGEQSIIRLRDGSMVRLNVDSRLEVPGPFGDTTRAVMLMGEAYFEVKHDPVRPFVVRSERSRMSVLGTRFAVSAYPGDDAVEVLVAEGKVSMDPASMEPGTTEPTEPAAQDGDGGAILTRGQLGRLPAGATTVEVRSVRPDEYLDWTQRKLSFRDLPLDKVVSRLERWYDIAFQVGDSALARERLTASFDFDEDSLGDVLAMISISVNATYHADGQAVTFIPKTK